MNSLRTQTSRGFRRGVQRRTVEWLESRRLLSVDKFGSEAELEQFLVDDALVRYQGLFGQPGWPNWWWGREGGPPVLGDGDTGAVPGHSETNVQVSGVDEGDLVETDGDFLYVLSGQQLVIADALPAEEMAVSARVNFDGFPFAEYLMGDRLTVLSHEYVDGGMPWWGIPGGPMIDVASPFFFRTELVVTVFDVADRAAPTVVQETRLDATHVDSRAIGNLLYLVTSGGFGLPAPELTCTPPFDPTDPTKIDPNMTCVYETQDEYLARIEGEVIELGMPHYTSQGSDGVPVTGLLTEASEVYRPLVAPAWNLLSIVVIDTSDDTSPGPEFATSLPTDYASQIYASTENLYVANPTWRPDATDGEAALLLKFQLDPVARRVDLSAWGEAPGRLLNQFSIDEHEGYLRVATTQGWGPTAANRVVVFAQNGESLEIVGQSDDFAVGEQIFAVRFQGDRAFVVTFLRIDPLFALDLSDPRNPRLAGELEVPGFSNYLQPVGETDLIGIGRNADEFGRVEELQVSLFDVADLNQPALKDRDSVDAADWAYSEATENHHAVGYFPEYGVLAIPVSSAEWVQEDRDGDGVAETSIYRPRTELWVWRIDSAADGEEAVQPLGRIEHDSYVRRSVRIGDILYSISDVEIKAHQILDPTVQLGALYYGQDDVGVGVFEPSPDDHDAQRAIEFPETTAPQVVEVSVANSQWNGKFVDWLDSNVDASAGQTVGFTGVDQIKVVFSEDVDVSPSDLIVTGRDGRTVPWYGFDYDAQVATATWTFGAMDADQLTIRLSDAVRDLARTRLDGDSDGQAGGAFQAVIDLLPGDIDRNGAVDLADLNAVRNGFGTDGVGLTGDVNADGRIDLNDLNVVRNHFGATDSTPLRQPGRTPRTAPTTKPLESPVATRFRDAAQATFTASDAVSRFAAVDQVHESAAWAWQAWRESISSAIEVAAGPNAKSHARRAVHR